MSFITSPPPPLYYWYWSPPPPSPPIVAQTLIVISVVVFLTALILLFSLWFRKRNTPTSTTPDIVPTTTSAPQRERRDGLDISTVQMFPILLNSDVRQLKEAQGQIECAICMSEFEDDDILRMLPGCCHVFHLECIGTWLALRVTCPVCRINLKEIDVQHA